MREKRKRKKDLDNISHPHPLFNSALFARKSEKVKGRGEVFIFERNNLCSRMLSRSSHMRSLPYVVQHRARARTFFWCFCAHLYSTIPKKYLKSPKIVCMGVFPKSGPLHGALYYIYVYLYAFAFAFAGPYFLFMIEQWAWKTRSKKRGRVRRGL